MSVAEDIANTNKSKQNWNNFREAIVFVRSKAQFIQYCRRNEQQYVGGVTDSLTVCSVQGKGLVREVAVTDSLTVCRIS